MATFGPRPAGSLHRPVARVRWSPGGRPDVV